MWPWDALLREIEDEVTEESTRRARAPRDNMGRHLQGCLGGLSRVISDGLLFGSIAFLCVDFQVHLSPGVMDTQHVGERNKGKRRLMADLAGRHRKSTLTESHYWFKIAALASSMEHQKAPRATRDMN